MATREARELEQKEDLHGDCARCAALCCVALSFSASAEFAADKPTGLACANLVGARACAIHDDLRGAGYAGCATFDCFGAGQHVSTHTCADVHWERGGAGAARMFAVFEVMRRLKELLWYLADALQIAAGTSLGSQVDETRRAVQALVWEDATTLERLDVLALQDRVFPLLTAVSAAHRAKLEDGFVSELTGGDLSHADLGQKELRGADLSGADLSGAGLAAADLTGADLLGADIRGADVRGAQLAGSLYLTQLQVDSAVGDEETTLPEAVRRPARWGTPQTHGS